MSGSPLSIFHPLIAGWFAGAYEGPTDIQEKAWPQIADGNHVLITAPTGSGKTLTAFLWAIHQLVTGVWPGGQVRVVYVSPLKALNNDIQRNLITPLADIAERFADNGTPISPIRVMTRSGDTPQDERRRMQRHPPEILITTPESLNIIINSKYGRRMLSGVASVILDEIHAVVSNKRGTHLMTAVDRLVPLCGEFQRIALSATIQPLPSVASFIGGYEMSGDRHNPIYRERQVTVIRSGIRKKTAVRIHFPEKSEAPLKKDSRWPVLAEAFREVIQSNRSTLLFTNSRRLAEKVARFINDQEAEPLAYAHHGSLSREIRLVVEQRLKNGELKAIVATSSLELGIDIGHLDQVVLVQSPPSISSAIQRIGRSGHRVGDISRGRLYPTHGRDLIHAAVLARCVTEQDIEPVNPVICPLDVLAQVILGMTLTEIWDLDALYGFIKTIWAYRHLTRRQFNLVVEMLAGRYADTRIRELKSRVSVDRVDNTIKAKDSTRMLLHMAGGTIPDRGYFNLRFQESKAKIGELDEEFVWERRVGETFALGTQTWKIMRMTHNDLEVIPARIEPGIIPFWRAEARNRDFHFSEKLGTFLEMADEQVQADADGFVKRLRESFFLELSAAENLSAFLLRQKEITGATLPHRHHLLIEHFNDPLNTADAKQVILHTIWGGRINRPYAMALSAAWEHAYQYPLEIFADDDAILLILPHKFEIDDLLKQVNVVNVEHWLRTKLETTGLFGARFRENAGRALLLPRIHHRKRMPLWLNRLRSKKLLEAVKQTDAFPILLETWRTCLQDEFDLENLRRLLDQLENGEIKTGQAITTSASPFAAGLIFQQTNKHMYEDDTPTTGSVSALSRDLIQEVAGTAGSIPGVTKMLRQKLEQKLQRTAQGYAPRSSEGLLDWIKERLVVPEAEWSDLLSAMERDHDIRFESMGLAIETKLVWIKFPAAVTRSVCALENLPRLTRAFGLSLDRLSIRPFSENMTTTVQSALEKLFADEVDDKRDTDETTTASLPGFLGQFLSYYGPMDESMIEKIFGLSQKELTKCIETLMGTNRVVRADFLEKSTKTLICDRENFEILLRLARKSRQPTFEPLSPDDLPLFVAAFQGLTQPGETGEALQDRFDQLFGFVADAAAWEEYILPARMSVYYTAWLDSLMQSSELAWFGCGHRKMGFAFAEDFELFITGEKETDNDTDTRVPRLIPSSRGKYSFFDIAAHSGMNSETVAEKIWSLVWQGKMTNDTFAVMRMGVLNNFKPARAIQGKGKRGRFNRWRSSRPLLGNWYLTDIEEEEMDAIDIAELQKERVRQLFRRYGILFREILIRELPGLSWGGLFKTLRLMELSGEIVSGLFFKGIPGLQFISYEALRFLHKPLPEDTVYWMNATDPASLCGVKIEGRTQPLPHRLASTFLVFHGKRLVVVCRRTGKHLDIHVPADHPKLQSYFSFFKVLTGREFNPRRLIRVEKINDAAAVTSPYAKPLRDFGFSMDDRGLTLRGSF
jgi:ATP-dependent Lhr-like helicase